MAPRLQFAGPGNDSKRTLGRCTAQQPVVARHLQLAALRIRFGKTGTLRDTRADCNVNHKRKRSKQRRAGCLLCKPNKLGKGMEKKLGHRGFGKLRKEAAAEQELVDTT